MARPIVLAFFIVQFVVLVALAASWHNRETSDGCLYCHADKARMEADGYPQFFMTREQVEKESRMPGVTCRDCHLGDGRSRDKDKAHAGMLKMLVIDQNATPMPRKGVLDSIAPTGDNRMYAHFPKVIEDGELYPNPDVFTVLWHDRDPVTLGYDPEIAKKTCGKSGCHPDETGQWAKTIMGGNVRQRSMRHWTDTHGPNNCGPSWADLPPEAGASAGFSDANYNIIKGQLSCPSTYENAKDRQRFCNLCHGGCMDCHFDPNAKTGIHTFTRRVPSTNCNGGGRGTGMCHAGTQERRRGDTYLGNEFSQPAGMPPDVHVKAGLECVDCHETGASGMGDIQRAVDCGGCHYSATLAHEKGVHKKLRCTACHTASLGGYQMTVWGKGHIAGKPSPFKKYSLYYGVMERPIIIKDQDGFYTPYKVWPNMATNMKDEVARKDGVTFRWPDGETRDAYAMLGTFSGLPGANKALGWLQLEAVGHGPAKARTCGSCHDSTAQKAHATWEYLNYAGAEPFTGEQDVEADEGGLRVVNIRPTSEINLIGDAEPWDFAAWLYMGDFFRVKGDFSIPKADAGKYRAYVASEAAFRSEAARVEARLASLDKTGKDYEPLARKLRKVRDVGEHDPAAGIAEIRKAGL
ncbi:MAG: cytochrome c3 family protein [Nitrospirae bacterium]|nr:cytochrome c3 family protein [Nitrospirota bacterium]